MNGTTPTGETSPLAKTPSQLPPEMVRSTTAGGHKISVGISSGTATKVDGVKSKMSPEMAAVEADLSGEPIVTPDKHKVDSTLDGLKKDLEEGRGNFFKKQVVSGVLDQLKALIKSVPNVIGQKFSSIMQLLTSSRAQLKEVESDIRNKAHLNLVKHGLIEPDQGSLDQINEIEGQIKPIDELISKCIDQFRSKFDEYSALTAELVKLRTEMRYAYGQYDHSERIAKLQRELSDKKKEIETQIEKLGLSPEEANDHPDILFLKSMGNLVKEDVGKISTQDILKILANASPKSREVFMKSFFNKQMELTQNYHSATSQEDKEKLRAQISHMIAISRSMELISSDSEKYGVSYEIRNSFETLRWSMYEVPSFQLLGQYAYMLKEFRPR